MKKITLSIVSALFALSFAFGNSFSQEGHYLWDEASQSFEKRTVAPDQEEINATCVGLLLDCYYTLDETGTIKNVIALRN